MNSVYSEVVEIFEERNKINDEQYEKRRKEAFSKIGELYDIERRLREISSEMVSAVIGSSSKGEKIVREYRKKSLEVRAQQAELLVTAGFSMDYLERNYDCKKCRDKGYIGATMCECFKKELRKARYRRSGLGKSLTEQTFKTFDLSYYSDTVNKNYGVSSKDTMKGLLTYCKKYAENFTIDSDNLILMGKTGLGKTFMSSAIARTVIDVGYGVIYETAQNIVSKSEKSKFNNDEQCEFEMNEFLDCDLLIIDDLGTEFLTSFTTTSLYNVINSRLVTHKPTIISTNLSPGELNDRYDERIVSRLTGEYITLYFFGDDIRAKKLERKNK